MPREGTYYELPGHPQPPGDLPSGGGPFIHEPKPVSGIIETLENMTQQSRSVWHLLAREGIHGFLTRLGIAE
jgi:hypothetical protein